MHHVSRITFYASRFTHHASRTTFYAALLIALVDCAESPRVTPTPATITLAASSTLSALLDNLADEYQAERPWITIHMESLDSEAALDLLGSGALDLAFVSWLPSDLDPGVWSSPLAYDAVAVIVNPANPVAGLNLAQVRDIFRGRALDWSLFGWSNENVTVVSREDGSGTRAAFEALVMDGSPVTPSAIVQPDGDAVVDYVARTPGAIGYVSRGRVTPAVKPIAIEGIEPEPSNAVNNSYPLGRLLYVVARNEPTGAVRDFVAWLFSPEGQQAIAERDFGRVK